MIILLGQMVSTNNIIQEIGNFKVCITWVAEKVKKVRPGTLFFHTQ
jgi:hypothetical protein